MFCENCGKELTARKKYCPHCGEPIAESFDTESEEAAFSNDYGFAGEISSTAFVTQPRTSSSQGYANKREAAAASNNSQHATRPTAQQTPRSTQSTAQHENHAPAQRRIVAKPPKNWKAPPNRHTAAPMQQNRMYAAQPNNFNNTNNTYAGQAPFTPVAGGQTLSAMVNLRTGKGMTEELDNEFRLLVYFYYDMLIFLFVDKKFNVIRNIDKVKKVSHWVDKFFKDNLNLLTKTPKMINENHIFCYTNRANRSIRLCNVLKKNQIDEKIFEIIKRAFFNCENNEMNSLTKFKGYYVYYIKSIGRRIIMLFKDNLTMAQLVNEINKVNRDNFFYIFLK